MKTKPKYRNVRTNGFASKKEAKRYQELVLLEKAGKILGLKTQVRYPLDVCGMKICTYIADFRYYERAPRSEELYGATLCFERLVVEDCKGFRTPIYKLKKKLMLALHGIEILET